MDKNIKKTESTEEFVTRGGEITKCENKSQVFSDEIRYSLVGRENFLFRIGFGCYRVAPFSPAP